MGMKIGLAATAFVGWAVWYDKRRRSRPDYKKNLVEKRKNELIEERKKNDPSYYVNEIPLCTTPTSQQQIQIYTMQNIQKGEEFLEVQEYQKGAAYIACGLAYMPEQMYLATLQQLAQGLPPQVVKLVRECGLVARPRAKKQQMEFMFKKQEKSALSQGDAKIQEVSEVQAEKIEKEESKPIEEPEDVDSIDGDTEEAPAEEESKDEPKVQELEEDDIDEEEQEP